jgi:hypothetical protein
MDNRNRPILEIIKQALTEHERLGQYSSYAPIYNSKSMLLKMQQYVNADYRPPVDHINQFSEWNVGLLAAKALDFDFRFETYTMLLHDAWNGFLTFLNRPRTIPLSGNQRDAYNFYLSHGFSQNRIWNHLDGIDFGIGKDFDAAFQLNQHGTATQWKTLCIPQGDYYGDKGKTPNCLGIHDRQED